MGQTLLLPINNALLTASIDTSAYHSRFGFRHCGCDLVSARGVATVYAGGNGTVSAVGYDNACGNVVAVVYPSACNHRTGMVQDIALRYFHLASVSVAAGQPVTKDTVLGYYGHTGKYAGTGPHLHLEADLDTVHVLYTPTVTSSNYLKGTKQGAYPFTSPANTVISPVSALHCKTTGPDYQSYATARDAYIRVEDYAIPLIP